MPTHNFRHFTGKKGGKKSKPKHQSERKYRKLKKKPHKNKYKDLAEKRVMLYSHKDKTFRYLPVCGKQGETLRAGLLVVFHHRRYRLLKDVVIPIGGETIGSFRLEIPFCVNRSVIK